MKTKKNKKKDTIEIIEEVTPEKDLEYYLTKYRLILFMSLIVYTGIIIYFAVLPGQNVDYAVITNNSVIWHFIEYFGLTLIAIITFMAIRMPYFFTLTNIYCIIVAAFTEIIQLWVPGRSCSLTDFLVDVAGIGTIWIITFVLNELITGAVTYE